jgi:hypothetical protein
MKSAANHTAAFYQKRSWNTCWIILYNEQTLKKEMKQGVEFIFVYDGPHPVGFASFSKTQPEVYNPQDLCSSIATGKRHGPFHDR